MAGLDTEKPRRQNRVVSALGATRSPRLADRRLRRPAFEETEFLEVSRGSADQAVPNEEAWSWTRAGSELGANEARPGCWPRYGSTSVSSRRSLPLRSGWIGDGRVGTGWHRKGRCCSSRSCYRWSCAWAWKPIFAWESGESHADDAAERNRNNIAVRCGPPSAAHCPKWPRGSGRVCQTPELATPRTVYHNSASRVVASYQTRWTGFCPDLVEACLTPSTDELPRWNGWPIAIMLPHPKPGSCRGAEYRPHRDERPGRRTSRSQQHLMCTGHIGEVQGQSPVGRPNGRAPWMMWMYPYVQSVFAMWGRIWSSGVPTQLFRMIWKVVPEGYRDQPYRRLHTSSRARRATWPWSMEEYISDNTRRMAVSVEWPLRKPDWSLGMRLLDADMMNELSQSSANPVSPNEMDKSIEWIRSLINRVERSTVVFNVY